MRSRAELTLEQAAGQLGWSITKVSRIETARVGVTTSDLKLMLDLYGVAGERRHAMIALGRTARTRGWWDAYADSLPERHVSYIALEFETSAIRSYRAQVVPGLFQTGEYAREIIGAALLGRIAPAEVERRVEARLTRQRLLTRDENPVRLWTVIDEAALRRRIGSPEVMRRQRERLLAVAVLPNVTVQVLPVSAGAHPATAGSFSILQFPGHDPDVACAEIMTDTVYVEDDAEVYQYSLAFDRLCAIALSPEESGAFVARVAGQDF